MNEILCRYCGNVMDYTEGKTEEHGKAAFFLCHKCLSVSPMVQVLDGEDGRAKAEQAASRRQLQKPLTLEEVKNIEWWGEAYIEIRVEDINDHESGYAAFLHHKNSESTEVYFLQEEYSDFMHFGDYNKEWRVWDHRPTAEERDAAKWEE